MKISGLTNIPSTIDATASGYSNLIINYQAASDGTPATYRISLEDIGKALSNKLAILNYDATNRELKAYSISSGSYTNSVIGYYLNSNQVSKLTNISAQANKSDIAYDGTNKKITKTVDGTTSDVVSAATLKTDMALNNVENKSSATIRSELTNTDVTTALGFTPYDATNGASAYTHGVTNKGSEYYGGTSENKTVGLFKIKTNGEGHVIAASAVEKSDITALGIPGDVSSFAPIASPAFTGNISLNKKSGTTAGADSIAVGYHNAANGDYSVALGRDTEANGTSSFAGGENTVAAGGEEFVIGCHNALPAAEWQAETEYAQNDYVVYENKLYYCASAHTSAATFAEDSGWYHAKKHLFTIGNGNNSSSKSNAFVVNLQGDGRFKGDVYIGCNADSSGGNKLIAIPEPPTTDGTYTLQVVVSSGVATYSWI